METNTKSTNKKKKCNKPHTQKETERVTQKMNAWRLCCENANAEKSKAKEKIQWNSAEKKTPETRQF